MFWEAEDEDLGGRHLWNIAGWGGPFPSVARLSWLDLQITLRQTPGLLTHVGAGRRSMKGTPESVRGTQQATQRCDSGVCAVASMDSTDPIPPGWCYSPQPKRKLRRCGFKRKSVDKMLSMYYFEVSIGFKMALRVDIAQWCHPQWLGSPPYDAKESKNCRPFIVGWVGGPVWILSGILGFIG